MSTQGNRINNILFLLLCILIFQGFLLGLSVISLLKILGKIWEQFLRPQIKCFRSGKVASIYGSTVTVEAAAKYPDVVKDDKLQSLLKDLIRSTGSLLLYQPSSSARPYKLTKQKVFVLNRKVTVNGEYFSFHDCQINGFLKKKNVVFFIKARLSVLE